MELYAPHAEQPKVKREKTELNEGEQVVYSTYTNPEYIEKLVSFLSLEENKGKDKYSSKRMTLFKVRINFSFFPQHTCMRRVNNFLLTVQTFVC